METDSFRLEPASGDIQRFRNEPNDDASLSDDHVKALHIDASDHLWIGTDGGGVNRLKLGDNTLERYALGRHAGAGTSARIRSIASDPNGILWIVHTKTV